MFERKLASYKWVGAIFQLEPAMWQHLVLITVLLVPRLSMVRGNMVWGREQEYSNIDQDIDRDKLKNVFKHLFLQQKDESFKRTGHEISLKVRVDRLKKLMETELGRSHREQRTDEDPGLLRALEMRWFNRMY